jgi:NDP-sugar pyrophosphorylase family protein
MVRDGQLHAMELPGFWMDVGQPKDYLVGLGLYLNSLAVSHPEMLSNHASVQGPVLVDPSVEIGKGCKIGPNVSLGPGVKIGEGVRLRNCAVFAGTHIKSNTWVERSIIGWRSTIGRWVTDEGFSTRNYALNLLHFKGSHRKCLCARRRCPVGRRALYEWSDCTASQEHQLQCSSGANHHVRPFHFHSIMIRDSRECACHNRNSLRVACYNRSVSAIIPFGILLSTFSSTLLVSASITSRPSSSSSATPSPTPSSIHPPSSSSSSTTST